MSICGCLGHLIVRLSAAAQTLEAQSFLVRLFSLSLESVRAPCQARKLPRCSIVFLRKQSKPPQAVGVVLRRPSSSHDCLRATGLNCSGPLAVTLQQLLRPLQGSEPEPAKSSQRTDIEALTSCRLDLTSPNLKLTIEPLVNRLSFPGHRHRLVETCRVDTGVKVYTAVQPGASLTIWLRQGQQPPCCDSFVKLVQLVHRHPARSHFHYCHHVGDGRAAPLIPIQTTHRPLHHNPRTLPSTLPR